MFKYKFLSVLFLILFASVANAQTLRQSKNYHGGYNYYLGGKLILQSRPGFGKENIYDHGKKVGEVRTFNGERKFYFTRPTFLFQNGKVILKSK